jgi:hypothetical protein
MWKNVVGAGQATDDNMALHIACEVTMATKALIISNNR